MAKIENGFGFRIDGAVTMPDIQICGDAICLPDMNAEYKTAIWSDGVLFATKDDYAFVIAPAVSINGKTYTAQDFFIVDAE